MEDETVKSDTVNDAMEEYGSLSEGGKIDESKVVLMTPRRIYKNVIVLSLVFMLNFLSFGGLSVLQVKFFLLFVGLSVVQSSLHRVAGMGTTTQSILYAFNVVSSLLLPKLATQKLGHKHCVSLAIAGYIVWMAANGYAVWWTMVPASALVGICAGPFWTAGSSYITILGKNHAQLQGLKTEVVLANFFGIFNMGVTISGLFANIISSTVLRQSPPENFTGPSEEDLALCGINDCPGNNVTSNINLQKPAEDLVWTLVGIYIGIAVIGLIISVFFLDAIPAEFLKDRKKTSVLNDLQATFRQLIRPKQLLLIPISMYVGLSVAFKMADWNKSFVTCNLGIWMVGYTCIVFCTADAAMSFLSGKVVQITGWIPVFILGMCLELSAIFTYIFWTPDPQHLVLFFVLPVISGIADGIWQSQIRAIHGFIFHDHTEAAFSSYNVWKSLGFFLGFGYSSQLCMIYKLYVLIVVVVIGVLCYCIVSWRLRVEKTTLQKRDEEAEKVGLNATEKSSA